MKGDGKNGMEATELEFSTTSIAITSVRTGVDVLAQILEESTSDVFGDLVEPIEEYSQLYSNDGKESMSKCMAQYKLFDEHRKKQDEARDRFYTLKQEALE